jgi:hypothetical protein
MPEHVRPSVLVRPWAVPQRLQTGDIERDSDCDCDCRGRADMEDDIDVEEDDEKRLTLSGAQLGC